MRKELRDQKRRRYLDSAITIVMRDGFDALTMGAIAREVHAAVGTIYGYFPSKGALVSELQVHAVETIVTAWREARTLWSEEFSRAGMSSDERLLAELLAYGEYFSGVRHAYPHEFRLQQMQLAERHDEFGEEELGLLVPAATELMGCSFDLVNDAVTAGVIRGSEDTFERSVCLALALNGISLIENVPFAADLVVPDRMSRALVRDLVISWGADAATVGRLLPIVGAVAASMPLDSMPTYFDHQARVAQQLGIDVTIGIRGDGDTIDLSEEPDRSPVGLDSLPAN